MQINSHGREAQFDTFQWPIWPTISFLPERPAGETLGYRLEAQPAASGDQPD
jgi:hypothetical protein